MKKLLLLFISILLMISCVEDTFKEYSSSYSPPSDLTYMTVTNGREGKLIVSAAPTVSTGALVPYYEIVSVCDGEGNVLGDSYMEFVSVANPETSSWSLDAKPEYPLDENGDPITGGINVNYSQAGAISIAEGNNFTSGDYYFTIKVTTTADGQTYSTVFEKAFHIYIEPLLPSYLIYQLKTQNLVYGDADSKTNTPLLPVGNKDVRFSLESDLDKLSIDSSTGVVSLSSNYVYNGYDTIRPTIKITSNISQESVSFATSLVVIVTDVPKVMPVESVYFFYPILSTTGSYPIGGDGYTVQTIEKGNSTLIWGQQINSAGGSFVAPGERPSTNGSQKPIEAATNSSGSVTTPVSFWCITTTQDLSVYNVGYDLSFNYYYMPAYQNYMADGRTPTDLEVYVSTDYAGGIIQDASGVWSNGTWTQINAEITCQIGGTKGAPWEEKFIGTPYPGDQTGEDPDGRKDPVRGSVYGKWIKCSYDVSKYKNSKTFTVAFKVASYFTGELTNKTTAPGRGGRYFLSDIHYVATEIQP